MTRSDASEIIALGFRVTGNTYPHKDAIRDLGCAWDANSKCWFAPTKEAQTKAQAAVDGTLWNSPPPVDTTGDESAESLAAKFGRTAVAGAEPKQFSVYGLWKGENGDLDGTIHTVNGVRYVQVARTQRRYLSRDWLDDMDMFDCEVGGSYQWTGVAVEPTAEEAAEDKAESDAKAKAIADKAAAVAKAKAESEAKLAQWEEAKADLVETLSMDGFRMYTGKQIKFSESAIAKEFTCDGVTGWQYDSYGYDDDRTYFYLPKAQADAAMLTQAMASGITKQTAIEWMAEYSGCHGADLYRFIAEATGELSDKLDSAAKQIAAAKAEEKRMDLVSDAIRVAIKDRIALLAGSAKVTMEKYVNPGFGRFNLATVAVISVPSKQNWPESITVTIDDKSAIVAIVQDLPPESILVQCSLGQKKGYQVYRLHVASQEFTAAWPIDVEPRGQLHRPTSLGNVESAAYKVARKKAGAGFVAPFGV